MTAPRCRHTRAIIASAGDLEVCVLCPLVRSRTGRRVHPWREATPAEREPAAMLRRAYEPASPGRPPLPADEARTHTVEVRVSAVELRELDAYAARLGCGRSEAVRRAIVAARGGA